MSKIILTIMSILLFFVLIQLITFFNIFSSNYKKYGFKKAVKRIVIPDLTTVVNIFVPIIVLWLTYQANQEGAGLLKENEKFLETARNINEQAETFQKQSLESFKTLNNETKNVLDGASEMNKRSVDFLEASKGSLETFRNTANELQKVLQSNIDLANKQIEILTKTLKREEEIMNRTAIIDVYCGGLDLNKRKDQEPVSLDVASGEEWTKLNFVIGNSGLIPLKNPIILLTVNPSSVCIKDSTPGEDCNFRQFSGLNIISAINPGTLNKFPIEVKIPNEVKNIQVNVQISGEGLQGQVGSMVIFKVNRLKPTPTVPTSQKTP